MIQSSSQLGRLEMSVYRIYLTHQDTKTIIFGEQKFKKLHFINIQRMSILLGFNLYCSIDFNLINALQHEHDRR